MSGKQLTLRLEMTSDWHIGTGAGIPGSIDALLARDGDGFPCIPAKTIIGIWRDAMETLTLGLDNGDASKKVWQQWVDVIFGSQPNQLKQDEVQKLAAQNKLTPRPSILLIEPASLNTHLRDAIGNDEQLRQALTFIKPNTAIESESGTAKTESLRFTEMGRIGTVLEAEAKLDFDMLASVSGEQKELIEALLVASAALVERIGGNRRRGSGKCEMQVIGAITKQDAITVLRNSKSKEIKLPEFSSVSESLTTVRGEVASEDSNTLVEPIENKELSQTSEATAPIKWKRIKYSLKLQTPVAIVTNTLGNVSETLDFIPGTYLLPHIRKQLKGISKYVAAGDFQVSPATIDVAGVRGLPVPKVLFQHKVDGGFDKLVEGGYNKKEPGEKPTVYNLIREADKIEDPTYQKKNFREGYVSSVKVNGTLPFYGTTRKILLMHNTVRDDIQRPDETVGGVFSRQAIKAGTALRGEIRLKESIAAEVKALEMHTSNVRLGTSKKDDYGLAELTLGELENDPPSATVINNELIVYFESDVLLRNGNLRQTNLVDELKSVLEKELSIKLTEKDSLIQVRRIESWHEGWGFPRPTLTAMAAGSVVVFGVIGTIDPTTLQNLELSGIGERRGEGYGRVRFNPPLLSSAINSWAVPTKTNPATNGSSEALAKLKAEIHHAAKLKEFISVIELAAWRDELARAVLKLANEPKMREEIFGFNSNEEIPSMSQIGGFRSAIGRLEKPKDKNVIGWLEHLEATSNRLEKWDKNKDKERAKKKLEKIKELISDENKVWLILCETKLNDLKVWNAPNELIQSSDILRKKLWAEAVKSLFDACARAHKRDTED